MSVCVCVCVLVFVCLSVREHISGTTYSIFAKVLRLLPMAVALLSSGGVAICYALPVSWMFGKVVYSVSK